MGNSPIRGWVWRNFSPHEDEYGENFILVGFGYGIASPVLVFLWGSAIGSISKK
jgi:hypothetical protein